MQKPFPPASHPGDLAAFRALIRASFTEYFRHAATFLSILLVRLVPFYVFLWYFPVAHTGMHAIIETVVLVPALAALVRFVWETVSADAAPTLADAVLGSAPVITLKLLGTNLIVVFVVIVLSLLGPTVFFGLLLVWSFVNLITDQVVVVEGRTLFRAIIRSFELVRQLWPVSVGLLLVLAIPDIVGIVVYSAMEETVWREFVTRGITVATMPFSVIASTFYYRRLAPGTR